MLVSRIRYSRCSSAGSTPCSRIIYDPSGLFCQGLQDKCISFVCAHNFAFCVAILVKRAINITINHSLDM